MNLTDDQVKAICAGAFRRNDLDLAMRAKDALESGIAKRALESEHRPCGECGEPLHGQASPMAHVDCDHPDQGTIGAAEGYQPSGVFAL